jgi:thymidylate kinase
MFAVVVGIDGSGKSTLLRRLAQQEVATADWLELRNYELPAMLAPEAPTEIRFRVPPLSRAMFIGGHLVAQYEYLVRPRRVEGGSVVLDSYYLKLRSKEMLLGALHPSLDQLCAELPQPDLVVFVDVPPEISFKRKLGIISPYEHYDEPTEEHYIRFQIDLRQAILELARSICPTEVVDGDADEDSVLARVLLALQAGQNTTDGVRHGAV